MKWASKIKLLSAFLFSFVFLIFFSGSLFAMQQEEPVMDNYGPNREPDIIFSSEELNLTTLTWNADETYAVLCDDGKLIKLFDFTQNPINYTDINCDTEVEKISWGPNNKYLALTSQSKIYIYDAQLKQIVATETVEGTVDWSPNSEYIIVGQKVFKLSAASKSDSIRLELHFELPPSTGRDEKCWDENNNYLGYAFFAKGGQFDDIVNVYIWDINSKRMAFKTSFPRKFRTKFHAIAALVSKRSLDEDSGEVINKALNSILKLYCRFPNNPVVINQLIDYLKSFGIESSTPNYRYLVLLDENKNKFMIWDNEQGRLDTDLIVPQGSLTWSPHSRYLLRRDIDKKYSLIETENTTGVKRPFQIPYDKKYAEINFLGESSKVAFSREDLEDSFIRKGYTKIYNIAKKQFEKNIQGTVMGYTPSSLLMVKSTESKKYPFFWNKGGPDVLGNIDFASISTIFGALIMTSNRVLNSILGEKNSNNDNAFVAAGVVALFASLAIYKLLKDQITSKIISPLYCLDVYTKNYNHVMSLAMRTAITEGYRESVEFIWQEDFHKAASSSNSYEWKMSPKGTYIANKTNIYSLSVPASINNQLLKEEKLLHVLKFLSNHILGVVLMTYVDYLISGKVSADSVFFSSQVLMMGSVVGFVSERFNVKSLVLKSLGFIILGFLLQPIRESILQTNFNH